MDWDAELAGLCAESYLPGASVETGPDLACNITWRGDHAIAAFRGTANARGWLRDFDVLPRSDPMIGLCHAGFLAGAGMLLQLVELKAAARVTLAGHSLGGALAIAFGALRIAHGDRVDELVTFGAPKVGYTKLSDIWAMRDPRVRLYRNGNDPVPTTPITLVAFPYQHIRGLRNIGLPDDDEPWNCHSIRLYQAVVKGLPEDTP